MVCLVSGSSKTKPLKEKRGSLSTDEELEHIQHHMAEDMASAQEAASNTVSNENEAHAMVAAKEQQGESPREPLVKNNSTIYSILLASMVIPASCSDRDLGF